MKPEKLKEIKELAADKLYCGCLQGGHVQDLLTEVERLKAKLKEIADYVSQTDGVIYPSLITVKRLATDA